MASACQKAGDLSNFQQLQYLSFLIVALEEPKYPYGVTIRLDRLLTSGHVIAADRKVKQLCGKCAYVSVQVDLLAFLKILMG